MTPRPAALPTGAAEARRGRNPIVRSLLPALLVPLLAACGDDTPTVPYDEEASAADAIQHTLRQRTRAIVSRDPVAFGRTLAQRDAGFVADQQAYLENLGQLPLGAVRITAADETLEEDGEAYWAEVTVRLELQGYDVAPVVTRDRWRFAPSRDGSRYLLASTTDKAWEADHDADPQPWDLGEIEVIDGPGVLGIFDATTIGDGDDVVDAVSEARFSVRSVLPVGIEDPGGVVIYSLGDPAYVDTLDGLPFRDPDRLDGLTIPVPRDAADPDGKVASYRILLNPDVLDEEDVVLDRLVRHELTHVAVGDHGRGLPLWFTEGIAEYVSVQAIAPSERRLQVDALNLAAAGIDELPTDADFAGQHAEGWYAVSWWACEYIAATYGEDALWDLLEGLADGADQETVITDKLGISGSELVQRGIDLMRNTYG